MAAQKSMRSLGPIEAKAVLTLEEKREPSVTVARLAEISGISCSSAQTLAKRLVAKGWLERITSGTFTLIPASYGAEEVGEANVLALASLVLQSSCIGWWAAAAYHGFTTQSPTTIHVAALKQASPRMIAGRDVHFVKLVPRKFFGGETYEVYGRHAQISGPTKTVVDCADRMDLCGGPAELLSFAEN